MRPRETSALGLHSTSYLCFPASKELGLSTVILCKALCKVAISRSETPEMLSTFPSRVHGLWAMLRVTVTVGKPARSSCDDAELIVSASET